MKRLKKLSTIVFIFVALAVIFNICFVKLIGEKYGVNSSLKNQIINNNKNYVTIDKIPKDIKVGAVLLEDKRFYSHQGYDIKAITRAFIANMKSGKIVQGGSTITQQLAKNLFLNGDRSMKRKFNEFYIALNLEENFTKDEILEMYLNVIYYGEGAYGIADASKKYFNKDVWELNKEECAMLVVTPQSPSLYNPLKKSTKLEGKKDYILGSLKEYYGNEKNYIVGR